MHMPVHSVVRLSASCSHETNFKFVMQSHAKSCRFHLQGSALVEKDAKLDLRGRKAQPDSFLASLCELGSITHNLKKKG